jgi:hypothetical protein
MRFVLSAVAALIATLVLASSGSATVMPVTQAYFAGLPVTTFDGWADNTEVNGLTVDGIPTNGQLKIDGTDSTSTLHVLAPLIDSPPCSYGCDPPGTLLLTLPRFADALGYGFAELYSLPLPDATTITLFSGNTPVGSLVYSSNYDNYIPGGFAGIGSTIPFNRVAIDFSIKAGEFQVDNIHIAYETPGVIPEPGTLLLVTSGIGLLAGRRLFRRF